MCPLLYSVYRESTEVPHSTQIGIALPLAVLTMNSVTVSGTQYELEINSTIPIHTVISVATPWQCFGIDAVRYDNLFKIRNGVGCNCDRINFCPHANGTHYESRAHVYEDGERVIESIRSLPPLLVAKLIKFENIKNEAEAQDEFTAVIVKTSMVAKHLASSTFDFTGTNPPYIHVDVMRHILKSFPGLKVLLVDLPSVDPESDGGKLSAHKLFFSEPRTAGIVELCHIPNHAKEGTYALSLNVAPFDSDASPCAPVIYPLKKIE